MTIGNMNFDGVAMAITEDESAIVDRTGMKPMRAYGGTHSMDRAALTLLALRLHRQLRVRNLGT
jgi:hypothetical protein